MSDRRSSTSESYRDDVGLRARTATSYDPFTNRPLAHIFPQSSSDYPPSGSLLQPDPRLPPFDPRRAPAATMAMYEPLHLIHTQPDTGPIYTSHGSSRRTSQESYRLEPESPTPSHSYNLDLEPSRSSPHATPPSRTIHIHQTRRRPYNSHNPDEFDGPCHLLPQPTPQSILSRQRPLLSLPTTLTLAEQSNVLDHLTTTLSTVAYHFIAQYQFPIPSDPSKPIVSGPASRDWPGWAHLLIRLATKRRIPKKCLLDDQIAAFVTVINAAIEPRWSNMGSNGSGERVRDDRNVLQSISAATQVARLVRDGAAVEELDRLYSRIEDCVIQRQRRGSLR